MKSKSVFSELSSLEGVSLGSEGVGSGWEGGPQPTHYGFGGEEGVTGPGSQV